MSLLTFVFFLAGVALLVVGGDLLVRGAGRMASALGVSPLIIGLTVVAFGTSAPEAAVTIQSTLSGEGSIALGNVIGSNLFNLLLVLGLAGLLTPGGVIVEPNALAFDLPVMLGVALLCLPLFFTHNRITRWEGWLLLGYYGSYITYLVISAAETRFYQDYRVLLTWLSPPLLALPLIVTVLVHFQRQRLLK